MQIIKLDQIKDTRILNKIRAYCCIIASEHGLSLQDWLDWLTDQYRDLDEPIFDASGTEVFLDMECFECSGIRFWFRDFLKLQPETKPMRLRRKSKPRVLALVNILAARDPEGTAFWFD